MEFRTVKIGDICEVVTDYVANGSFKSLSENVKYYDKGYARVIRLVDYNNKFEKKDSIWVSKDAYEFLKKSKLEGGEIVITNVGANLGTVFIAPQLDYPQTLGPNSIIIKTKENDKYIYYLLLSRYGQNKIKEIVSGSAMPKFNKTDFKNIIIQLPSIENQKKVVKMLSALDKKIELNNKINDNLLEIINTLYKNEFIDVKEYKRAEEIADITIGKTPPRGNKECFSTKNEDVKWASIADLGKCGTYILDTREKLTKEAVDNYNVKVIPKNTIILSFKLTIGRIAITSQEMATNEAIAHFNLEDKDMLYYLYSYLKNFDYEKLGSTSSIATAVNSKIIKAMPIVIPDKETLENYNEKVSSMFEKIRENEFENKKLEQLRDTLLPELMNGEIDLDNIKI
jgi:type I restriction enzyme S subunit